MNGVLDIRLVNSLPEIRRLAEVIEAFGVTHGVPDRVIFNLNLALDEILSNVIEYALADDTVHEILVRLTITDTALKAEVIDDGPPYDPTLLPDPDTSLSIEDRPVGGLGVYFAKRMMDRLEYCRDEGANRLTMIRLIDRGEDLPVAASPSRLTE